MALRVEVYRREQYYCLMCGDALSDVNGRREYIECVNSQCPRKRVWIMRPDVVMCNAYIVPDPKKDGDDDV